MLLINTFVLFSTPIKSVLAFRLYLEYKQGAAIPTSLFDQAKWWSEKYHLGGNEDDFKQKVDDDESGKTICL